MTEADRSALSLACTVIPDWPPLAWLARCCSGDPTVVVRHGPRVEVHPSWFAEAVWADAYDGGEFDRTDLVFGSGGRVREGSMTFVSSGTTVDRLHVLTRGAETLVSNSLPCLLAAVDGVPDPTFPDYYGLFKSIIGGLTQYRRELPTSAGPVRLVYFDNLEWNGTRLGQVEKPVPERDLSSFERYQSFLQSTLSRLHENLTAPQRRFPYRWLATISSGYDSLATAILARPFGLQEAITVAAARGGGSDSGAAAAQRVGITASTIARDAWCRSRGSEIPFLAGDGKGEDVFLAGAADLLSGRALLTGQYGIAWDKHARWLRGGFERKDQAGLSLTEFRLWAGFVHCPIPYLGARQVRDVVALSRSPEMRPWDVGGSYTRPIPRRIIESAGISRGSFATRKRAGSVLFFQRDSFLSAGSLEDFLSWLQSQSAEWRTRGLVPPVPIPGRRSVGQRLAAVAGRSIQLLSRATGERLWLLAAVGRRLALVANREPLFRYVFPWAIAMAKQRYAVSEPTRPDRG